MCREFVKEKRKEKTPAEESTVRILFWLGAITLESMEAAYRF